MRAQLFSPALSAPAISALSSGEKPAKARSREDSHPAGGAVAAVVHGSQPISDVGQERADV